MAVTISTKFYQTTTGGDSGGVYTPSGTWNTLSKIVYTSPNITSPTTAGVRSHILPGELPLALWYEDTGNMYRKANSQVPTTTTTSGNYAATVTSGNWGSLSMDDGFHAQNSIQFEVTTGECYDCRFTAWDSITHTTTNKFLISTGRVRCSAVAYRSSGTRQLPTGIINNVGIGPIYNTTLSGNGAYYGDFDMIFATPTTGKLGDFLIVKPWLSDIDASVPFLPDHNFVLTLHYSYT
jgi:hypothetical protein